jgi:DNA-binding CsgD family transcriptional regulator
VARDPGPRDASQSIIRLAHSSLSAESLRTQVLARIGRVVAADAIWWAGADPATLLFTNAERLGLPAASTGYFVDNEFLADDFNKWTELAGDPVGVRSLAQATEGALTKSARYRDVFEPMGLGDELRAVLRIQGSTWGLLCLHRETGHLYSRAEALALRRIAPHLAEGLRVALLIEHLDTASTIRTPGLVLLSSAGSLIGTNPAGEEWLAEIAGSGVADPDVPIEVRAVAARLRGFDPERDTEPRLRIQTRAGRWAVLHASWMTVGGDEAIAIIIEQAASVEVAAVIMRAYGLTNQERVVTGLVARGSSTAEIAAELRISPDTAQDHLKSIYGKVGVGSRTQLVAAIMRQQYLPRAKAGDPVGPDGFFA